MRTCRPGLSYIHCYALFDSYNFILNSSCQGFRAPYGINLYKQSTPEPPPIDIFENGRRRRSQKEKEGKRLDGGRSPNPVSTLQPFCSPRPHLPPRFPLRRGDDNLEPRSFFPLFFFFFLVVLPGVRIKFAWRSDFPNNIRAESSSAARTRWRGRSEVERVEKKDKALPRCP